MILINVIKAYLERLEAIRTLRSYDDRFLRDVGITRGEIERAVRGTPR